jgi:hypothetical protein
MKLARHPNCDGLATVSVHVETWCEVNGRAYLPYLEGLDSVFVKTFDGFQHVHSNNLMWDQLQHSGHYGYTFASVLDT